METISWTPFHSDIILRSFELSESSPADIADEGVWRNVLLEVDAWVLGSVWHFYGLKLCTVNLRWLNETNVGLFLFNPCLFYASLFSFSLFSFGLISFLLLGFLFLFFDLSFFFFFFWGFFRYFFFLSFFGLFYYKIPNTLVGSEKYAIEYAKSIKDEHK